MSDLLSGVGDLGTGVPSPRDLKIGAATSLAVVRDLGAVAFLTGAWRIGAAMPLVGLLSGTQASAAWRALVPKDHLRSSPGWAFPIMQQQRI